MPEIWNARKFQNRVGEISMFLKGLILFPLFASNSISKRTVTSFRIEFDFKTNGEIKPTFPLTAVTAVKIRIGIGKWWGFSDFYCLFSLSLAQVHPLYTLFWTVEVVKVIVEWYRFHHPSRSCLVYLQWMTWLRPSLTGSHDGRTPYVNRPMMPLNLLY